MEIVALCCDIEDFCLQFELVWNHRLVNAGNTAPVWVSRLCLSEVMTIVVSFPQSGSRTFKDYVLRYGKPHLSWAFPLSIVKNKEQQDKRRTRCRRRDSCLAFFFLLAENGWFSY